MPRAESSTCSYCCKNFCDDRNTKDMSDGNLVGNERQTKKIIISSIHDVVRGIKSSPLPDSHKKTVAS